MNLLWNLIKKGMQKIHKILFRCKVYVRSVTVTKYLSVPNTMLVLICVLNMNNCVSVMSYLPFR